MGQTDAAETSDKRHNVLMKQSWTEIIDVFLNRVWMFHTFIMCESNWIQSSVTYEVFKTVFFL